MKNQISPRDIEQISAYLDNQLGNRERLQFEARLKTDPMLQKELHEISKTRLLLRSLPKLRAPRNYFIKAPVSRARPVSRLSPALGVISAVASILLVLLVFGDAFYSATSRASVPASAPVIQATNVVEEVQRSSSASAVSPTEAARVVALEAPAISTPAESTGQLKTIEMGSPTPTTIYVFAMPPTSTPFGQTSILEEQTETANAACSDMAAGGGYPPGSNSNCPTPSGTSSLFLQSVPVSESPTPSATPTITETVPLSIQALSPSDTPTPSETPMPTDTPTLTGTPSPTQTPTDTVTPLPVIETSPSIETGLAPEAPPSSPVLGAGNPAPSTTAPAKAPDHITTASSSTYAILIAEMSLAAIAIIAGVTAFLLRFRSGR